MNERANKQVAETELGHEQKCNRCGEFWPFDEEFWYRSGGKGFHSWCKACYDVWRAEERQRKKAGAVIDLFVGEGGMA